VSRTLRKYWFWPAESYRGTQLLLRPERSEIYINHDRKIHMARPRRNRGSGYWQQDDAQCSHTASHYAYLTGRLPDSSVASIHVVGYAGQDYEGNDYKLYFAPSIGCQELRFQQTNHNAVGIPTYVHLRVVDSYALGAPDPKLFSIPEGYQQVKESVPGP
jgi:hypothetical protein